MRWSVFATVNANDADISNSVQGTQFNAVIADVERLYERCEENIRCVRSTAAAELPPTGAAAVR